jgi:phosphoribosylglycinamide formyltransferase-1
MAHLRLAVLISGRGSNMAAIAKACAEKRIDASICTVISDQPDAAGLPLARSLGLTTRAVPFHGFANRTGFERALREAIETTQPQVVVLAGFMRILSAEFVEAYLGRMFNIHPSLLPKYRGLHTHRRVLEAGDREHGSSVHFVTAELDGGPIVLQSRLEVRPDESEAELSARVQATEYIIYPQVIGWMAEGRLAWREGAPWFDGKALQAPLVEEFGEPRT